MREQTPGAPQARRAIQRTQAERYVLITLVAFAAAVISTGLA